MWYWSFSCHVLIRLCALVISNQSCFRNLTKLVSLQATVGSIQAVIIDCWRKGWDGRLFRTFCAVLCNTIMHSHVSSSDELGPVGLNFHFGFVYVCEQARMHVCVFMAFFLSRDSLFVLGLRVCILFSVFSLWLCSVCLWLSVQLIVWKDSSPKWPTMLSE